MRIASTQVAARRGEKHAAVDLVEGGLVRTRNWRSLVVIAGFDFSFEDEDAPIDFRLLEGFARSGAGQAERHSGKNDGRDFFEHNDLRAL